MNMLRALGRAFGVDPDRFERIVQDYERPSAPAKAERRARPDLLRELVEALRDIYGWAKGQHGECVSSCYCGACAHLREGKTRAADLIARAESEAGEPGAIQLDPDSPPLGLALYPTREPGAGLDAESLAAWKADREELEMLRRKLRASGAGEYRRGVEDCMAAAIDEAINACGFEGRLRARVERLLAEGKE